MKKVKFSLRALILIVTALAAFFGYSQYRRLSIRRECEALSQMGVKVALQNDLRDQLWQRVPIATLSMSSGELPRLDVIRRLRHINARRIVVTLDDVGATHRQVPSDETD
jgi:hypothetical protein